MENSELSRELEAAEAALIRLELDFSASQKAVARGAGDVKRAAYRVLEAAACAEADAILAVEAALRTRRSSLDRLAQTLTWAGRQNFASPPPWPARITRAITRADPVLEDAQQRAPATANWQEIFAALCVDPETPLPGEEGVSGSPQAA